jgi:hypothetical protein
MTEDTREQLLRAALAAVPNGKRVAEFFAEGAVLELPFLASMGIPWSSGLMTSRFASPRESGPSQKVLRSSKKKNRARAAITLAETA